MLSSTSLVSDHISSIDAYAHLFSTKKQCEALFEKLRHAILAQYSEMDGDATKQYLEDLFVTLEYSMLFNKASLSYEARLAALNFFIELICENTFTPLRYATPITLLQRALQLAGADSALESRIHQWIYPLLHLFSVMNIFRHSLEPTGKSRADLRETKRIAFIHMTMAGRLAELVRLLGYLESISMPQQLICEWILELCGLQQISVQDIFKNIQALPDEMRVSLYQATKETFLTSPYRRTLLYCCKITKREEEIFSSTLQNFLQEQVKRYEQCLKSMTEGRREEQYALCEKNKADSLMAFKEQYLSYLAGLNQRYYPVYALGLMRWLKDACGNAFNEGLGREEWDFFTDMLMEFKFSLGRKQVTLLETLLHEKHQEDLAILASHLFPRIKESNPHSSFLGSSSLDPEKSFTAILQMLPYLNRDILFPRFIEAIQDFYSARSLIQPFPFDAFVHFLLQLVAGGSDIIRFAFLNWLTASYACYQEMVQNKKGQAFLNVLNLSRDETESSLRQLMQKETERLKKEYHNVITSRAKVMALVRVGFFEEAEARAIAGDYADIVNLKSAESRVLFQQMQKIHLAFFSSSPPPSFADLHHWDQSAAMTTMEEINKWVTASCHVAALHALNQTVQASLNDWLDAFACYQQYLERLANPFDVIMGFFPAEASRFACNRLFAREDVIKHLKQKKTWATNSMEGMWRGNIQGGDNIPLKPPQTERTPLIVKRR